MNERLRALVLTPDFPPDQGGIQLVMSRLVSNLKRVESRVVTFECPGAPSFHADETVEVARIAKRGGPLHRVGVVRLNVGGIMHARRFRPDVIVSGHMLMAPGAAVIRKLRPTPVIQYLHADETRHRPGLVRFAMAQADAVVAVSRHARDLALRLGCDASRVHVVNPGVDPPPPASNGRAERPTVLTVSRMHDYYKGHDVMLRAMPLIRDRVPEVEWVVIGDGPLRRALEARVAADGVADCVRFLGMVSNSERDAWLDRAHVFALPSRIPAEGVGGEGFGIAYLEASAHRLPVVAGSAGGSRDAVVDGETGSLVDAADHAAVAEAISDLLLDPGRAGELGRAGVARASQFTWQRHASAVEQLMFELCSRFR